MEKFDPLRSVLAARETGVKRAEMSTGLELGDVDAGPGMDPGEPYGTVGFGLCAVKQVHWAG